MLTQLLAGGGLVVGLLLAIFGLVKSSRSRGRVEGKAEVAKEYDDKLDAVVNEQNRQILAENKAVVEEVEKTHEVHDKLKSDPAYAGRVRTRFTRD